MNESRVNMRSNRKDSRGAECASNGYQTLSCKEVLMIQYGGRKVCSVPRSASQVPYLKYRKRTGEGNNFLIPYNYL